MRRILAFLALALFLGHAVPALPNAPTAVAAPRGAVAKTTFAVADVTPAPDLLKEMPYDEQIQRIFPGIVAFSGQTSVVVGDPADTALSSSNQFIYAVDRSFSEHRPLVLSPDHMWLLICQGFAAHVNLNAESMRGRFVDFEGRQKITVQNPGLQKPWDWTAAQFAEQATLRVKADVAFLHTTRFSTTRAPDITAYDITLMDGLKTYFYWEIECSCGFPTITLEGTPEDWKLLLTQTRKLRDFELGWWVDQLEPVLHEFVRASEGQVDKGFWNSMYKREDAYETRYINGWVTKFFPYIGGDRNKFGKYDRYRYGDIPRGLACVDAVLVYDELDPNGKPLEFIAGFLGVEQNRETKALRPQINWLVREKVGAPPVDGTRIPEAPPAGRQ